MSYCSTWLLISVMNTETPLDGMKLWLRATDVVLISSPRGVPVTVSVAVSLKSSTMEEGISAMKEEISPWMAVNLFQTTNFFLLGKENVFYETRINPQTGKLFQLRRKRLAQKDNKHQLPIPSS